ncbi:hypothetical protein PoHVEF18_007035 [Penicillium ochrochloron]
MVFEPKNAPQPLIGSDGAESGIRAHAAHENPWRRGRRNSHLNEPALYQLHKSPFLRAVQSNTVNKEAFLAHATGSQPVPGQECVPCQQGQGPFDSCVVVPGIFSDCANCHWSQQSHRCSFNTHPPDFFVPKQQAAQAATTSTSASEVERDIDQELHGTRLARDEAIARRDAAAALVERLDRRIDELLGAKAARKL